MQIKLSNRIFFRQARNALLVAVVLGFFISIIQIIYDLSKEQERTDETIYQVLNTVRESATQAAFSLNNELSLRVVNGLFEYRPIYSAQIIDDFGHVLARLERPLHKEDLSWLGSLFNARDDLYVVKLYLDEGQVITGEMRVHVDRFLIAQDFLERAGLVIITGVVRNIILALFFGLLFYMSLGHPVMRLITSLSEVDPTQPDRFHIHIPEGHADDELGLLIRKLNNIMQDFGETLQQRFLTEEELKRNQDTIRILNMRLEERVRQRTSELESANREMEAFTYSVSHDLRAPLRTVSGFSTILEEEYRDRLDDQGVHYLNRVISGTKKMENLINDLLKLSRSTRGDLRRAEFNLSHLVGDIVNDLRQAHPDRNVEVDILAFQYVYADKRFVRVMLDNLIGNAWKYTQHKEKAEIKFGSFEEGEDTVFFIRDNGAGFDMQFAEKIFAPFQRLHNERDFEGTGVGLATVQRVINRHGGRVWVEAEVDQGATFYFVMPTPIIELVDE